MRIEISIPEQSLTLQDAGGGVLRRFSVSTAANGPGERKGSYCTPRGRHVVRAKIGAGAAFNTVFVGRRPTGEIWSPTLADAFPRRDWILTLIMWLCGREPGFNRFGVVDTMRRYIYIHGSPDTVPMGTPGSIGCIRMRNYEIVDLFDRVPAGTAVEIIG
jgi:lipoprotein-anchoring transpeptidase ErfK/SrfK